ncbi:MAG: conserved membrane protein of unknown function [Candidatus Thorarchaeota archaeon]|nr:MAG: conserved membrane protein of unknown function [Candidatus Thorarchaeota archaeon]
MDDERNEDREEELRKSLDDLEPSEKRYFNPLVTYLKMIMMIFVGYGSFYILGYPALITVVLIFLINLGRETHYILQRYSYPLARRGAIFNMIQSLAAFLILAINGYFIQQYGQILILPQIENLTLVCPLFVMVAIFGNANIIRMFRPDK